MTSSLRALVAGLPSTYWYLWIGALINRVGGFVVPFLAIYLTVSQGFSVAAAGAAVATYGVGGIVATLLGGTLADRLGRRRTLLLCTFASPVVLLALPLATSRVAVFALVFLLGALYELWRPPANAAVADVVPIEDRQRAFVLKYWALNLGFAIGASLGGLLATKGYIWLFVGDALTTLLYGALIFFKVPETRPASAGQDSWLSHAGAPFRDGVFTAFITITLGLACIFTLSVSMLPIEMVSDGLSPALYGRLIAINGAMIVCLQPFIAQFIQRFQSAKVMATAAIVLAVGFGSTAFASTAGDHASAIVIWTLGEMCWLPVGPTIVSLIAPPQLRGAYQGAYGLAWAVAMTLGPWLGGAVLDRFGSQALWLGAGTLGILCAIAFVLLAPALKRATDKAIRDSAPSLTP
ncbi:MAG TPA: MFS transporter [Polyangiaceae bacterium]|nr:MFS transporter [Polyangiaceae bacterium]